MVSKLVFGILLGGALSPVLSMPADSNALTPAATAAFDPWFYDLSSAMCKGIDRSDPAHPVTKDLRLQYLYLPNPNATRTLLLVHGWPGSWINFKHQIQHFGPSYSLIVPMLRGFGFSNFPGDVQNSGTIDDIDGDLFCIMKAAGVSHATCVGHDWGSQLCYEAARSRPDLIEAVAGIDIPYQPSVGNFTPIDVFLPIVPHFAYQVYFANHTSDAIAELNKDPRRSLRSVQRDVATPPPDAFLESTTDFLGAWGDGEIPPIPFHTSEEEDYMVEHYIIAGFDNSLQFYTTPNKIASFNFAKEQGNLTIPQPTLLVIPDADPVANWTMVSELLGSASFIPQLTTAHIFAAHWPMLEQPHKFNQILENWLNTLPASAKN